MEHQESDDNRKHTGKANKTWRIDSTVSHKIEKPAFESQKLDNEGVTGHTDSSEYENWMTKPNDSST